MEFTAEQIAAFLGGSTEGNSQVKLVRFSKIEEASEGSLCFLANPKYESYIYTTQASAVMLDASYKLQDKVPCTLIRVENAYAAFAKLMQLQASMQPKPKGKEEPSFVSEQAQLGKDVYVGAFAYVSKGTVVEDGVLIYPQVYIGENVHIGAGSIIYAGAKIYADTVIGKNCIVHSGAVIGADGFGFAPTADGDYEKIPQLGNVVLEDNVEIGANATIDRATMGSTLIRKGVKIDNLVQVAHNVEVGESTVIAAQSGIAGSSKVGKHCMFGGQVGIAGHLTIPDGVKAGAKTGFNSSLKGDGEYFGTLAMPFKDYMRAYALFRKLPDLQKRINELERALKDKDKQ